MARSHVLVPSAGTIKLATHQYTDGANVKDDEVVVLGEPLLPTYSLRATAVATTPSTAHVLQIMAGATLNVRIRRIRIVQRALAGAAASFAMSIVRLSTAGTGGGVAAVMSLDTTDAAAGCTAMTHPTAKGTETGADLIGPHLWLPLVAAQPVTAREEWRQDASAGHKPLRIAAGVTNGIALKIETGIATATIDIYVDLSEAPY